MCVLCGRGAGAWCGFVSRLCGGAVAAWWGRWRLFVLCIAVPRMLSPNFGHRLSTQFSVEVLHASRTNLGMLDSVRHWVGLVSNPLGGYLARTRGIKWLIVLHTVRAISARSSLPMGFPSNPFRRPCLRLTPFRNFRAASHEPEEATSFSQFRRSVRADFLISLCNLISVVTSLALRASLRRSINNKVPAEIQGFGQNTGMFSSAAFSANVNASSTKLQTSFMLPRFLCGLS